MKFYVIMCILDAICIIIGVVMNSKEAIVFGLIGLICFLSAIGILGKEKKK